jgi:hypothetical protein
MNKMSMTLFCIFILLGCSTSKGIVQSEPQELSILMYTDNSREYLKNFILYKKYDVEMIAANRLYEGIAEVISKLTEF